MGCRRAHVVYQFSPLCLCADIKSGIHYMLGSWYTPREIGKRAMVFWLAGSIGQMFSGFLQAAAVSGSEFQHLSLGVYFAFQSALVRDCLPMTRWALSRVENRTERRPNPILFGLNSYDTHQLTLAPTVYQLERQRWPCRVVSTFLSFNRSPSVMFWNFPEYITSGTIAGD